MVVAEIDRSARGIANQIEGRRPQVILALAASTAGGVIVAQTIADQVLPVIGMPIDPETPVQFLADIAVKGGVGLIAGLVAAQAGGAALAFGAFIALGALASAGISAVEMLLRTAPLSGSAPTASAGGSAVAARQTSSATVKNSSGGSSSPASSTSW